MKPSLVIVGLGNPGAQYERTRHNVGYQAVDCLSDSFGEGEWQEQRKFMSSVQEARVVTVPVLLVKPQTYMNRSGEAIAKVVEFYKLDPAKNLLVISDDVDLPLGELRLRMKGGPGTHNGLKSIVQVYGEEFPRLRIGLGDQPPGTDLSGWVLSVPPEPDRETLVAAIGGVPDTVHEFVLGEPPSEPSPGGLHADGEAEQDDEPVE